MRFFFLFALTYLIMSIPDFLGFTFVIQWIPGISETEKAWVYFKLGLAENLVLKLTFSVCSSLLLGLIIKRKVLFVRK